MKIIIEKQQTKYFDSPAEDLSVYVIEPQKGAMNRKEIKQTIASTLENMYKGKPVDIEKFKQAIAGAKARKMDLSKIKVNYFWQDDYNTGDRTYSPLKYAAFNFFANEKGFGEAIRYLVANTEPAKLQSEIKYTLGDMFSEWHGDEMQNVYQGANAMSLEFIQTFKLLKDNGASIKDFDRNIAYLQTKIYQNPQFVDMLLQLQDSEINWTLSHAFYEVQDYQQFFDLINKYDLKEFSVEQAIRKIDGSKRNVDKVKFLLQKGKLDIKDFTQEKLGQTMEGMYFYNVLEDITLEAAFNGIKQEYTQSVEDEKKYSNKKSLSAEAAIDKIYEDAVANIN